MTSAGDNRLRKRVARLRRFVPTSNDIGSEADDLDDRSAVAEAVMFDKADNAESVEKLRLTFEDLGKDAVSVKERLGEILKDRESRDPIA